jgi:hypothetical protein
MLASHGAPFVFVCRVDPASWQGFARRKHQVVLPERRWRLQLNAGKEAAVDFHLKRIEQSIEIQDFDQITTRLVHEIHASSF